MRFWKLRAVLAAGAALAMITGLNAALAAELILSPIEIVDEKAVYGSVESINRVEARTRIAGTIIGLRVTEGSAVQAGQVVAEVEDPKLALRRDGLAAEIRGVDAELSNARAELERAEQLMARGAATQQRIDQLRTAVSVAENRRRALEADRSVVLQQMTEGEVLAPTGGRVLHVPVTKGSVVLAGESIASIATERYVLRIALPERHAAAIRTGDTVMVGERGLDPTVPGGRTGRIVKVYPELDRGRVIADVNTNGLGDYFVGERALVRIAVARRMGIAIPPSAVTRRHGLDYVRVVGEAGRPIDVVVEVGQPIAGNNGAEVEIISGLTAGDRVILP